MNCLRRGEQEGIEGVESSTFLFQDIVNYVVCVVYYSVYFPLESISQYFLSSSITNRKHSRCEISIIKEAK